MIRVSAVEKCTDAFIAETVAYLDAPADDTTLVLRHGGGVRGKKLLDAIRAGAGGGVEVVCAEIKRDADKYDFAAAEFRSEGRRVSTGALRALVAAFSDDIAELSAACRQLMSDAAAEITETTVERYYGGRVEVNAFKVADAAIAGALRRGSRHPAPRHLIGGGPRPHRGGLCEQTADNGEALRLPRRIGAAGITPRPRAVAGRARPTGPRRLDGIGSGSGHLDAR